MCESVSSSRSIVSEVRCVVPYGLAFAAALWSCAVSSTEIGPSDDLESASNVLRPGEELILRGGRYSFDRNFTITANGTPTAPITIRAKEGERPIIVQATTAHNVVEVNHSSYLILRGLEFTGGPTAFG